MLWKCCQNKNVKRETISSVFLFLFFPSFILFFLSHSVFTHQAKIMMQCLMQSVMRALLEGCLLTKLFNLLYGFQCNYSQFWPNHTVVIERLLPKRSKKNFTFINPSSVVEPLTVQLSWLQLRIGNFMNTTLVDIHHNSWGAECFCLFDRRACEWLFLIPLPASQSPPPFPLTHM